MQMCRLAEPSLPCNNNETHMVGDLFALEPGTSRHGSVVVQYNSASSSMREE